jgi:nitrite reductase (NADH) large subunit
VVIGGGLLGLEAANALKQLGLETHVVEFAPNLMAVQLDNDGAAMLRKKIEALGVGVHTSKATTEIAARTAGWCCALPMANSWKPTWWSFLPGFVRRTRWRAAAGWLSANAAGSALTTVPDLRSGRAGHRRMRPVGGKIFGLVAPGYQMARVAAAALAGEEKTFAGADMSTKLKLLGVDVASFGDAHGRTPGALSYQWTHGPQQIYKKIVVSHDGKTLLGGVLVGDASEYATLLQMMLNGMACQRAGNADLPASSGSAPKALGVAALPEARRSARVITSAKAISARR